MTEIFSKNGEQQQVKKLKRLLEGWRMALIPLKSVFLWEQQWHPCAIVGSSTILYFLIWLIDLNFLATVAVIGLIINFVDFIVPIICNSIYGASSWTGQKEKMFEEICESIVFQYNSIVSRLKSYYSLRETSPLMYYIISISMLLVLAWLSSAVNNVFLFYILSTVMLLWPGIQHRGVLSYILGMIPKKSFKAE